MYALTVRRPWAHLIIHCGKNIENRSWKISDRIIGQRIAIHAGRGDDWTPGLAARIYELTGVEVPQPGTLIGIIGTVRVVGTTVECISPWCQAGAGYWWVLADPKPLERPIPCRGRLGLWKLPANVCL